MKIVTKRFVLRDLLLEDEPSFFAYRADQRFAEFCTPEELTPSYTRKLLSLFHQWSIECPRRNYQLATASRQTSELIGCCGLRLKDYNSTVAEFGIELAPQFWSRYAYAIEVGQAVIEFGFRNLGLKEIRGVTVSANIRVARLARRYGFIPIAQHSSPDWMLERGWSQTEWQLKKEWWGKTFY